MSRDKDSNDGTNPDTLFEQRRFSEGLVSKKPRWEDTATPGEVTKAQRTIHQLYRDWSAESASERNAIFDLILAGLTSHVPLHTTQPTASPRILVPGAGLSRLALTLASRGYNVTANELDYHSLLASDFILKHTTSANQFVLHPFACQFSNRRTRADQLRSVQIPDVLPSQVMAQPGAGTLCLAAGDFCEIYGPASAASLSTPPDVSGTTPTRSGVSLEDKELFDAVVTLFFIDTAPNLLDYIRTIRHCLRPGGVWINVGPLLWHFEAEQRTHGSFEPSHEEIVMLLEMHGFEIVEEERAGIEAGYMRDERSMLQSLYRPVRWIARLAG